MAETNVGSPIKSCKNKKGGKSEEEQDPKKHWIKFKLVDTNNNPVKDVTLMVILPDGSREEKTTDKDGIVEIRNIEPGKCKLEFDWRGCTINDCLLIQ
jgi:hypothetical protein